MYVRLRIRLLLSGEEKEDCVSLIDKPETTGNEVGGRLS